MAKQSQWQLDNPAVRFYAPKALVEELTNEAAAQSLTLGDYIKAVMARRNLVIQREEDVVAAGMGNVECCFCRNLVPDAYIDRKRRERSQIVEAEPQGQDRPPSFDEVRFPAPVVVEQTASDGAARPPGWDEFAAGGQPQVPADVAAALGQETGVTADAASQ